MSPDRDTGSGLKFNRLRTDGESAALGRDLTEGLESPGKHSTLFQPPICEPRGRRPKASLDELLTRAISSTRGSSDAQRKIVERLCDLRARFEEGRLRVAVIGQFKRGQDRVQ